ncbi:MAG: DUF3179 domain-containing protein [Alphaproteobacteria bacterium]|nr:DUF3179 domain-containing protein [Alphaproteobacteria bacterium]
MIFPRSITCVASATAFIVMGAIATAAPLAAAPDVWRQEWPQTDFSKHNVPFGEIKSGGPPKDGIPSIDRPKFETLSAGGARGWSTRIAGNEPVVSVSVGSDARAYPIRILIWHEIVNDTVGGRPLAVTYCPLCNAALTFDRSLDGRVLDFGATGKLRHSDLVMYDRQTESWWQQFTGQAIVGTLTGAELQLVPSRLESFDRFRKRHPAGRVLVPNDPNARNYGVNPYVGYDTLGQKPFLYDGSLPQGIEPMERVVAVETAPGKHEAWALSLLRQRGTVEQGDLILRWEPGQASALDKAAISSGRDVGNVVVQRRTGGRMLDVVYDVTFAFAFHAFRPNSPIHKR